MDPSTYGSHRLAKVDAFHLSLAHTGVVPDIQKVQALAEVIYAEKYEDRVRDARAHGNPGAWVACFHFRRRAQDDARHLVNGTSPGKNLNLDERP